MIILALDPANVTGVAMSNGAQTVYCRWELKEKHKPNEHRLLVLYTRVRQAIEDNGVELIAFEEASFGSVNRNTQAMHNELRGIIKLAAAEAGLKTVGYHPTAIKKFATGDGRAGKPQMIRAAKTLLGLDTDDDNIADAAFILAMAQQDYGRIRPATSTRSAKKKPRLKPEAPKLF